MAALDLFAELTRLLQAFEQRGVEYAVCGGVALAIHGVPRATKDIDVMGRLTDRDVIREVARNSGFVFESLPMTFSSSGVTIQRFTKILDGQPLMLDVLFADGPLEAVWETRQRMAWQGGQLTVVSREGLITLKLAAGRPQDLVDVQRLSEVHRG